MPLLAALQVPLLSRSVLRSVVPLQVYHSNELNALVGTALPAAQRLLHARLAAQEYQRAAEQLVLKHVALRCFRCEASGPLSAADVLPDANVMSQRTPTPAEAAAPGTACPPSDPRAA